VLGDPDPRDDVAVRRRRCRATLEPHPWFLSSLKSTGLAGPILAAKVAAKSFKFEALPSARDGFKVSALLRVEPGQTLGNVLACRNREEALLFDYLGKPLDAFSLKVTEILRHICFNGGFGWDSRAPGDVSVSVSPCNSRP
jgi:hypothetical protein